MAVILIDCDGVMYEWDKTARYMMRTLRGYGNASSMLRESEDWDYIQNNVLPEDWDWLWDEGVRQGLFRYGHIVQNTIIGVRELAKRHQLQVVTHRPSSAIRDTLAWLDLQFGAEDPYPWSGIHLLTSGQAKSSIKGNYLVDDKPDNVIEFSRHEDRRGILFDRKWNEGFETTFYPRVHRAVGWKGVIDMVEVLENARRGDGVRSAR